METPTRADLPPALRAEVERARAVQRARDEAHQGWLRHYRWVQTALGAVVLILIMAAACKSFGVRSLFDAALGASAAFVLNALRGGPYRGMVVFAAAGALAITCRFAAAGFDSDSKLIALFFMLPWFTAALTYGYAAGLTIDADHFEHRFYA